MSVAMRLPIHMDASGSEFLEWLSTYLIWVRPGIVVEAGTFQGHFALVAAKTAQLHSIPMKIWTADVSDFGVAQRITEFELAEYITALQCDFERMLDEHIGIASVELAYIDSGPTDGVETSDDIRWKHLQAVMPYMKRGGLIIVDDTHATAKWERKNDIKSLGTTIGTPQRAVTLIEV